MSDLSLPGAGVRSSLLTRILNCSVLEFAIVIGGGLAVGFLGAFAGLLR